MINKEGVLIFLRRHFVLEPDYEEKFGHCFEGHPDIALKELIRVFREKVPIVLCSPIDDSTIKCRDLQYVYLGTLGRNEDPKDNVEEFIKGSPKGSRYEYDLHQWNLARFYPVTADLLNPVLLPLVTNISEYKNFEVFREKVIEAKDTFEQEQKVQNGGIRWKNKDDKEIVKSKLGFGFNCIYDFCLRSAFVHAKGEVSHPLLPSEYVYVHSKPKKSADILLYLGLIPGPIETFRFKYEPVKEIFENLNAMEIEHFLCVMHGALVNFDEKFYLKNSNKKVKK